MAAPIAADRQTAAAADAETLAGQVTIRRTE
jgi:hypothetical protein